VCMDIIINVYKVSLYQYKARARLILAENNICPQYYYNR